MAATKAHLSSMMIDDDFHDEGQSNSPSIDESLSEDELDPDSDSRQGSGLSRKRKRRATDDVLPPHKRKVGPYNENYIDFLNVDIQAAADRYYQKCPLDDSLDDSQLGAVWWTASEKAAVYEALTRLCRQDLKALAARVPTKSVVEIAAFIRTNQQSLDRLPRRDRKSTLKLDIPAAAEISQRCCLVLEEAADALSLQEEEHEESREKKKWGDFPWRISPDVAEALSRNNGPPAPPFVQLFYLPQWNLLSERFFMNASFPENNGNNWRSLGEDLPNVWSTCFQDFHTITRQITQRIVVEALRIAESRCKSIQFVEDRIEMVVKREDVLAAVSSLGHSKNSHEFWATAARRLRLRVVDDEASNEDEDGSRSDSEQNHLSYLSVERRLRGPHATSDDEEKISSLSSDSEVVSDIGAEYDGKLDESDPDGSSPDSSYEILDELEEEIQARVDDVKVKEEVRELLVYSAIDLRKTTRIINAVKRRITAEHNLEKHLDVLDVAESAKEENRLWEVLGVETPDDIVKRMKDPPPFKVENISVDDIYKGADWCQTEYVGEWEAPLDETESVGN